MDYVIIQLTICAWILLLGIATSTDILPSLTLPGGTIDASPSNGIYGNNVTNRGGHMINAGTPLTWIDTGVSLPAGTLRQYYVYGNHSSTLITSQLRLQIWRPTTSPAGYVLVWERRVAVDTSYPAGALYVYNTSVPEHRMIIQMGDLLGWTSEGVLFPVSMSDTNFGRAYHREVISQSYPTVGGTYIFDGPAFPFVFSAAVSIETDTDTRPEVTGMTPLRGPIAGGTRVTVTGLSLANPQRVLMGTDDMVECTIVTHNDEDQLIFKTPPGLESVLDKPLKVIIMFMGGGTLMRTRYDFIYKPNPRINDIYPLKTIPVGGTTVTVRGTSMDLVEKPILEANLVFTEPLHTLDLHDIHYEEICTPENMDTLHCPTPTLTNAAREALDSISRPVSTTTDSRLGASLYIGLRFDGVDTYKNISANKDLKDKGQVTLHSNPTFPEGQIFKFEEGQVLDIKGEQLLSSISRADYTVQVGAETCVIRDITESVLHCQPPEQPPGDNSHKYTINVKIGIYVHYTVGELHYPSVNLLVIILPIVLGILFLLAIIVLIVSYIRKKKQNKLKENKNLQKIYKLESGSDYENVRHSMDGVIDLPPIKRDF